MNDIEMSVVLTAFLAVACSLAPSARLSRLEERVRTLTRVVEIQHELLDNMVERGHR